MHFHSLLSKSRAASRTLRSSAYFLGFVSAKSFAALPQAQAPTRGQGSNWMQTFQNYAYDGFMFLGLCLCAFALILVGRHALGVYHEIHMGKAKWADLGATAVVGVSLIGVTIFLVTQATTIL